jgi:hypothetical protein
MSSTENISFKNVDKEATVYYICRCCNKAQETPAGYNVAIDATTVHKICCDCYQNKRHK